MEPAINHKIDTYIFVSLPQNSKGFVTSRLKNDKINEVLSGWHRLRLEILSKCFEDIIKIKEGQVIGFFVAEPENLKSQHVQQEGKKENAKLLVEGQKAKRQMGGGGGAGVS